MASQVSFKGTRWHKCDLHLHTTASLCFHDRNITAEQWVQRAIEQGLDCVAVTDHNTGANIDEIKAAASGTRLTVFPGVEITCDSSKIHLLIIFDVSKGSSDIRDFLVRAGIKAEDFGKQNVSTIESVFKISELAHEDGALVIPAHIDEYNGLGGVSVENLKKLFSLYHIYAIQIVHKEFLNPTLQTSGNSELKAYLNEYYDNPTPLIDDTTVKDWYTAVKYGLESKLAILTFSDNPHEPKNPKHGLWGIGRRSTWIKMDERPSLEGLRQAFLLPDFRIKNDFVTVNNPYTEPSLWIRSITVTGTTITDRHNPLKIEFNPQLNTIIGGRGSGKSSVLRFIRGVFNRLADLGELSEILNDHNDFYKREQGRPKKGVLTDTSEIIIEFVRNNTAHRITAKNISNSTNQEISIERLNSISSLWETIADEGYIDFFEFEHYSQKQIYEIAQEPNALRERIDKAIDGTNELKRRKAEILKVFLEKSAIIRTSNQAISNKGRFETRLRDVDESIQRLQQSGISDLLKSKERFSNEENLLALFNEKLDERIDLIEKLIEQIEIPQLEVSLFADQYQDELSTISGNVVTSFTAMMQELKTLKSSADQLRQTHQTSIDASLWNKDFQSNELIFNQKRSELEEAGINDIDNFEKFSLEKAELERQIEAVNERVSARDSNLLERQQLQIEFLDLCKVITRKRTDFISTSLGDGKVKIVIRPFRNQADFESRLRKIIQRENNTFQSDIDELIRICFTGNVEQKIIEVREIFLKIRKNEDVGSGISGHFINLVQGLNDAQVDEIELFMPEDEIEIQYKPTSSSPFKSLSTASAGQKTTAVLTFILSFGKVPLILDQPEDDLDNRLVYDLVVDRLKQAKESRQLVVVTHNANIPVNGDAEYIISLDTDSKELKILNAGTVDQLVIKKEICDVMEGGEAAFEMRSKRYRQINT